MDEDRAALRVSYSSLKASDFFTFFNLSEAATAAEPGGGRIVKLLPGNFRHDIQILVKLDGAENVTFAELGLTRRWIGDSATLNRLATDIAASFLSEFADGGVKGQLEDLSDALRSVHGTAATVYLSSSAETQKVSARGNELIETFVGAGQRFRAVTPDVDFTAENITNGRVSFLQFEVKAGRRTRS